MSGRYMSIQQGLWNSSFRTWDGDKQRCWLYLKTGPAQNILGTFVLSLPGMADDLQLPLRRVKHIITWFLSQRLISFDAQSRLCRVSGHFDDNPITSGNAAISAQKFSEELPNSAIWAEVAEELQGHPFRSDSEQNKLKMLIQTLRIKAGLHAADEADGYKNEGTPSGGVPEDLTLPLGQDLGAGVGVSLPYTAPAPAPVTVTNTPQSSTLVIDTETALSPEEPARPASWPLLERFATEVRKYNQRPLVSDLYERSALEAAESNLRDLQAMATRLGVNDMAEVLTRLRRPANNGKLRQACCPAVIVGAMAEYALRDLQPQLDEREHTDERDALCNTGRKATGDRRRVGGHVSTLRTGGSPTRTTIPPGYADADERRALEAFAEEHADE